MNTLPDLTLDLAIFYRAVVRHNLEPRRPPFELHVPVEHRRRGHDNQMWAPDAPRASEV